jgi:uncharacterized membrane protein (DUF485 family)
MTPFIVGLWYMLCGHALMDYPLQTDFIAKNKCPGHGSRAVPWYYIMAAHAALHGMAVTSAIGLSVGRLTPGTVLAGIYETVLHFFIDVLKCENCIGIHVDQLLHVACKLTWAASIIIYVDANKGMGIPALSMGAAVMAAVVTGVFVASRRRNQCSG